MHLVKFNTNYIVNSNNGQSLEMSKFSVNGKTLDSFFVFLFTKY